MSLTGSLEDLPLLDILQIVSFSKKTGWLAIQAQEGQGAIVFRSGSIVAAFAWDLPPLDPRFASLQPSARENLIRKRIEVAIEQLIWLREGQFQFSLGEQPPASLGPLELGPETLDVGLNPQELLLELARGMDEDRRESWSAVEAPFAESATAPALESELLPASDDPSVSASEPFELEGPSDQPSASSELDFSAQLEAEMQAPPQTPDPPPRPARDLAPEYTALRTTLPEYTVPLQAVPEAMLRFSEEMARAEAPPPQPPQPEPPQPEPPQPEPPQPEPPQPEPPQPEPPQPEPPGMMEAAFLPEATLPTTEETADDLLQEAEVVEELPELELAEEDLSEAALAPMLAEAEDEPQSAAAAAAQATPALLLVDDEDDVRRILAETFTKGGYEVVEAENPDAAVKKASLLSKAGIDFVLVTDLGMPTTGGASFHGGFEVVKRVSKMKLGPPVLMMAETLSPALRARAKQMGIAHVVFKPGLSKLDPEQHEADLRAFAQRLLSEALPQLSRRKKPQRATEQALGVASQEGARSDAARDLKVLQRHLPELRESPDVNRISMLVMRVAREFFERAVLLLVRNEEARGLAAFGPSGSGENLNRLVRGLAIPLRENSLLLEIVTRGKPWNGPLPDAEWSHRLLACIGSLQATRAALLPLVAHRGTIALLLGDNPESGRELGRLEALELFMREAGGALESALLQRKLRALDAPAGEAD